MGGGLGERTVADVERDCAADEEGYDLDGISDGFKCRCFRGREALESKLVFRVLIRGAIGSYHVPNDDCRERVDDSIGDRAGGHTQRQPLSTSGETRDRAVV